MKRLLKDCYPVFLITVLFLGHQLTGQGSPAGIERAPSSLRLDERAPFCTYDKKTLARPPSACIAEPRFPWDREATARSPEENL